MPDVNHGQRTSCRAIPNGNRSGPGTTAGTRADLTNQNSPLAAVFRNGASYTTLAPGNQRIGLQKIATGLSSPLMMALPGDGSGRMFVADQIGLVRIITADGILLDAPFLDLRDRMVSLNTGYDERGLLSIAFHPDFPEHQPRLCLLLCPPAGGSTLWLELHQPPLGVHGLLRETRIWLTRPQRKSCLQ